MYMLRDHENEKKFTEMMKRHSPNTLVKPSEKVLKVRKTILKAGTHKNILGQGLTERIKYPLVFRFWRRTGCATSVHVGRWV